MPRTFAYVRVSTTGQTADNQLHEIATAGFAIEPRRVVLEICRASAMPCVERRVSLSEFHSADEVFTSGTMGELAWVREIDGRPITASRGPVTARLVELFAERTQHEGTPIGA